MKKILGGVLALSLLIPASLLAEEAKDGALASFEDKVSYSIGLDVGQSLQNLGDDIKLDLVIDGLQDGFKGNDPKLTKEEISVVQQEFAAKMQAKQQAKLGELKAKNAEAGAAFLAENKAKEGVKVTESGLQYEVLKEGDGPIPTATDRVKVDYVGTLINGKEFDSSIKRGQPAVFGVNEIIPGWTEALQLMKVGSKYRIVIPANLAYGENGAPPIIEPNSVLIFDVDLLGIESDAEEKKAE